MATTNCALTRPPAPATCATFCTSLDTTTAAARVVALMVDMEDDKAFREAQRARREMDDALRLLRGFVQIGPNVQALTALAQDAAAFVARVEDSSRRSA